MGDKSSSEIVVKLVLVGSSGVGKTSLISTYQKNPFEDQNVIPTVAPTSITSEVTLDDGTNVVLQIWDTAGHERFQSISRMFYRNANVAFVCYDKDNEESLGPWIDRVRAEVPECFIFIIATKTDLLTPDEISQMQTKGYQLCNNFKATVHLLTSSKKGTGVDEAFYEAAKCAKRVIKVNEPVISLKEEKRKESSCC